MDWEQVEEIGERTALWALERLRLDTEARIVDDGRLEITIILSILMDKERHRLTSTTFTIER